MGLREGPVGRGSWHLAAIGDLWRAGVVAGLQCGAMAGTLKDAHTRPLEKEDVFFLFIASFLSAFFFF